MGFFGKKINCNEPNVYKLLCFNTVNTKINKNNFCLLKISQFISLHNSASLCTFVVLYLSLGLGVPFCPALTEEKKIVKVGLTQAAVIPLRDQKVL